MAELLTSESQFAFLFFHKFMLLLDNKPKWIKIPSTYAEGKDDSTYDYKGTDLVIDQFFIQFKLSKRLQSKHQGKFAKKHSSSYFYFETHNSGKVDSELIKGQHDFLVEHCQSANKQVWYVAPSFANNLNIETWFKKFIDSNPNQLDDFSCITEVKHTQHWRWTSKETKHHISYVHLEDWVYAHSESKKIKKKTIENFSKRYLELGNSYYENRTLSLFQAIEEILVSLTKLGIKHKLNSNISVKSLQSYLLLHLNIVWFPIVRDGNWAKKYIKRINGLNSANK